MLTSPQIPLTVYAFNVAQGDHLLLELPDGTFGLLDFHYTHKVNLALEPPGLTFLRERHAKSPVRLSFICLSHPDLDHIKGVRKVIKWMEDEKITVDQIWLYPGLTQRNLTSAHKSTAAELKKIINKNKAQGLRRPPGFPPNSEIGRVKEDLDAIWDFAARRKITVDLLQGVVRLENLASGTVEVCPMAPLSNHINAANESTLRSLFLWTLRQRDNVLTSGNLVSSVIKMRYGKQQLIFGGDAGKTVLEECLDAFDKKHQNKQGPCSGSSRASLIKASHHGSSYSSSAQIWERLLSPRSRIILSAGRNYRLKHPNRETIGHLQEATRNLETTSEPLTTNLCDRCLNQPRRKVEHFGWLPKEPRQSKHKESRIAVAQDAPLSLPAAQRSKVIEVQKSLIAHRPSAPSRRTGEGRSLAGYVFRLDPKSTEAEVTYATMPVSTTAQNCFFGGKTPQLFPECALPIRRNTNQ